MKKKFIIIVCMLLATAFLSNAQLGGLKNKVKNSLNEAPKKSEEPVKNNNDSSVKNDPSNAKSEENKPARDANATPEQKESSVEIDFKQQPFPPTILLSQMLEKGFSIHSDQPTPFFFLPTLVFLPTKDVKGNDVKYENQKYIYGVIKQGDNIIYKEYLEPLGNSIPTVVLNRSERYQVERPSKGLETGKYTCEVVLDGRTIFSMPFDITLVKNDDVYANDKEFRLMDGYWSKYGYISFTPDGLFEWNTFEANMDKKFVERGVSQSKECKVEQQLFYNGQPFSKVDEASYSVGRGEWTLESTTLVNINSPKTTTNYIKKEDLKDGSYTLKMKMNEEQREYSFNVKGGKPVLIDEQDKTKTTDNSKVFEGMNKEFWVRRSK